MFVTLSPREGRGLVPGQDRQGACPQPAGRAPPSAGHQPQARHVLGYGDDKSRKKRRFQAARTKRLGVNFGGVGRGEPGPELLQVLRSVETCN